METAITASEFERRVTLLSLSGFGPGLPRKRRDRHIFLKSVTLVLGHGHSYNEASINEALLSWLGAMGPGARMDHVSLRRYLIDEGYVTRDPAGRVYDVRPSEAAHSLFEPEVDGVDPLEIVRVARAEQEERRRLRRADMSGRRPS